MACKTAEDSGSLEPQLSVIYLAQMYTWEYVIILSITMVYAWIKTHSLFQLRGVKKFDPYQLLCFILFPEGVMELPLAHLALY